MSALFIMLAEGIHAEIVFKVTTNGVNMIRIILRVVVFNKQFRAMNPIVMGFATFCTAGPGKMNFFNADPFNLFKLELRQSRAEITDLFADQPRKQGALGAVYL